MSDVIHKFSFTHSGVLFFVNVVCLNEFSDSGDRWKMTGKEKAGVTIANPEAGLARHSYNNLQPYAIPLYDTLAERVARYTAENRADPSCLAYQELQDELKRDLNASDYAFTVSATAGGVRLFDNEPVGCTFDYSYQDDGLLEEWAADVWEGNAIEAEAVEMAKAAAREMLSHVDALKKVISE